MKGTFEYIKNRLNDQSLRDILNYALDRLAIDVADEFVTTTDFNMKLLSTLTGKAELKWKVFQNKVSMKCPSCGNTLVSDCARVACGRCREEVIVRSTTLMEICKGCISYQNKACPGALSISRKFGKPELAVKRTGKIVKKGVRSEANE